MQRAELKAAEEVSIVVLHVLLSFALATAMLISFVVSGVSFARWSCGHVSPCQARHKLALDLKERQLKVPLPLYICVFTCLMTRVPLSPSPLLLTVTFSLAPSAPAPQTDRLKKKFETIASKLGGSGNGGPDEEEKSQAYFIVAAAQVWPSCRASSTVRARRVAVAVVECLCWLVPSVCCGRFISC